MKIKFILSFLITLSTRVFSETESSVVILTPESFDLVIDGSKGQLVEFYAPWCGFCKSLAPTYEKLAIAFASSSDKVTIAKVDCDVHKSLCTRFGVNAYPTLLWFNSGSKIPKEYEGELDLNSLIEFVTNKGEQKKDVNGVEASASKVVDLTPETFDRVIDGSKGQLVEFYAPWCGHCKTLAPIYEKLATSFASLSDRITIAKIDCDAHEQLCARFNIDSYPTLKWFAKGSKLPIEYDEGLDLDSLSEFITKTVDQKEVNSAISAQPSDLVNYTPDSFPSDVVNHTPDSFDLVINSSKAQLVKFYAPWCHHCQTLAPTYEKLATSFVSASDKVIIAKVDCDTHKSICARFGVNSYPTLKWFNRGAKIPKDFLGGRDLGSMMSYVSQKLEQNMEGDDMDEKLSKVVKITPESFDRVMDGSNGQLVEFYHPWCGHCETFAPTYEKLGIAFADVSEKVTIAKIDCDAHESLCDRFAVEFYPVFKWFTKGSKIPEAFEGKRTLDSLLEFVKEQMKKSTEKVDKNHLMSVDQNSIASEAMIKRSAIPKNYIEDPNNLENIAIFQPTDNMV